MAAASVSVRKPSGYWKDIKNQRIFFDDLRQKLNVTDWSKVSRDTVLQHGGSFVKDHYKGSLTRALSAVYPEEVCSTHGNHQNATPHKPYGHWKDIDNQRAFFDSVATTLNVHRKEDWYNVSLKQIVKLGGSFVIDYYRGSLLQALKHVYPKYNWESQSTQKPSGYWKNIDNQRTFFEELARQLGVESPVDWYKISSDAVLQRGGSFIKTHYKGSLIHALNAVYPEHNWQLPVHRPSGYWREQQNQRQFFDNLASQWNIRHPEGWYAVTLNMVVEKGGAFVKSLYNGSLIRALNTVYQYNLREYHHLHFRHNARGSGTPVSKSQLTLFRILKGLFPDIPIQCNFRFYPSDILQGQDARKLRFIEFDVFIPTLRLAFEYQGETHYQTTSTFGPASRRQENDQLKMHFAKESGITLVPIPFWWDKSSTSIAATIQLHRPDIIASLPENALPISKTMPQNHQQRFLYKPNVPQEYDPSMVNPVGWLMMEKYDGVRVYWDGSTLYSKNMKTIVQMPKNCEPFPSFPFEGELWMGHNRRTDCINLLRGDFTDWSQVKIMVFDAPQYPDKPYTERFNILKQQLPTNHSILSMVTTTVCTSNAQLLNFFAEVCVRRSGEGIILRKPTAWYFEKDSFYKQQMSTLHAPNNRFCFVGKTQ